MRLGQRLRQVVAANFIEISREETAAEPPRSAAAEAVTDTTPSTASPVPLSVPPEPFMTAESAVAPTPAAEAEAEDAAVPVDPADASHWFASPADSEFADVVNAEGEVDFERLFRNADLPAVSCSAEDAVKILADMPAELPMRVRRITARATVERLSQSNPDALEHIISDASLKMVKVAQMADKAGDRAGERKAAIAAEIAALEAQIAAHKAMAERITARQETLHKACRTRMGELNDVVLFFDNADGFAPKVDVMPHGAGDQEAAAEELPPYLRDDAVRRMLGLRNEESSAAPAGPPEPNIAVHANRGGRRAAASATAD